MTSPGVAWTDGASLVLAAAALVIALVAWRNSDRNSSAATLLAIFEAFRQGWDRVQDPDPAKRIYHFHDLMNLFEVGSAIHQDRSVHGASRQLLEDYMCDALTKIAKDKNARAAIIFMREDPKVFEHLKRFLKAMRRKGHPHFVQQLVDKDAPADVPDPASVTAAAPPAAAAAKAAPTA